MTRTKTSKEGEREGRKERKKEEGREGQKILKKKNVP